MAFEIFIISILSGIFVSLLFITKSVIIDIKETNKLLKQICDNTTDRTKPVKPVNITTEKTKVIKYANCPICGKLTSSSFKHCDNCGTEIDWSDTE